MERFVSALGKLGMCVASVVILPAQPLKTLYSFCAQSECADGFAPLAGLVQGTSGELYGTAQTGGGNCLPYGCGTIFEISLSGTLKTLYSFCNQSGCTLGYYPSGLIQATNGDFYGTIAGGGLDSPCPGNTTLNGCGAVFKISPSGTLTILYSFCSQSGCVDGANPSSGVVQATNGDFYGTTESGGTGCAAERGCGTVFKITPAGTLTTLFSFDGTNGEYPQARLVQATNGNLYGTTAGSGATGTYGTVFKISPAGTLTTLHKFNYTDGAFPSAGLVQATDGNLYGTTQGGGSTGNGTVFKITPAGNLTTLYSFCAQSGCPDGSEPLVSLVQGADGNLYGTTYYGGIGGNCLFGGSYGCGTAFKITPSGTLTTLYSFCAQSGCTDGAQPWAPLVQATNGTFYGTTEIGGAYQEGTVFSIAVSQGPFVTTQPTAGKVGSVVKILGNNLSGATKVTFNGTMATIEVYGKTELTTTVPSGATTGPVKVVTPHGTLTSNVPFKVLP